MYTILYIEDDQEIGRFLKESLENKGYKLVWLTSSLGYERYMDTADLVVLDIMMRAWTGLRSERG
ncbi:hypothetical protein P4U97_10795 [Bacillus swezeyi]|uniref:hypothetical protein n=1 Tax=Bacillus swezeyi TaxID=1925020 RepID=UPI002E1DF572|nr:hypothetical protein [Bacillus swezeyi]